jgi:uncharacterized protein (DUF488 family)
MGNSGKLLTKAHDDHEGALLAYTIGHSTHPLPEFTRLLHAHSIEVVADVRTIPRSRHNPQFNVETLPSDLKEEGIAYEHMKGLGGLRKARRDSVNTGWRNASFRGFADYMQTGEFTEHFERLVGMIESRRTVIMCAEALPWRCHRSLISDALVVRGVKVFHISGDGKAGPHTLTSFARVKGTSLTYPG